MFVKLILGFLTLKSMEPVLSFRLNAVRSRSLTTETSSTLAHRISPIHRTSGALERNTLGQPAHLRVSKIVRSLKRINMFLVLL